MGTSVSQASPNSLNWKAVSAGYASPDVAIDRVAAELWRAAENQEMPISVFLATDVMFACYQQLKIAESPEVITSVVNSLFYTFKANSIVGELAKRAAPVAAIHRNPARAWVELVFCYVSDYLVSRDVSGYVGRMFRNRTIPELVTFKQEIADKVRSVVSSRDFAIESKDDWSRTVGDIVRAIREAA
jgi:hypothetical protein